MPEDLSGERVLVIGGSGDMGAAVARRAAALGAEVIVSGRRTESLAAVAEPIGARVVVGDVSRTGGVQGIYEVVGRVEHVVVAVSANARASSIPQTTRDDAQAAFARLWSGYDALHLAPKFVAPTGSVTLVSGSSARRPGVGFGVWTLLHGAIEALARAAALELAPIRVNVVSPGGIGMRPDRQLTHHAGSGDDIGKAVAMLLLNDAMTGAVLDVDGGERLGDWSG